MVFRHYPACSTAECAEHHPNQCGSEHDGGDADQACLHRGLAEFQLVRASARRCVLERAPHEREDSHRDRHITNVRRKIVEQRVDVSVH
jgi:hypothetical protein